MRGALLRLGEWLGGLAWLLGVRRAVALDGLRRAFPALSDPELRDIGRASYRQLGRSLAELLSPLRAEELDGAIRYEREEILDAALAQDRGVVCALAHFGNFELLARIAARRGIKASVIIRPLRDAFGRWLTRTRGRTGVQQLSDRGSAQEVLSLLRRGEFLGLLVDQNMLPSRGVFVDFFGE